MVPTGKLGDVVCVTQVFSAVRKHLPQVHIIAAGNSKLHKPLLADSGLADEYLDLVEVGAFERVKKCKADAGLVTGIDFKAAALFYLAGIPLVVAPKAVGVTSPEETRPYKILQNFIKTFPHNFGEYAPRERLKVLEPIGIFTSDTKKHLGFSEAGANKASETVSHIYGSYKYLVGMSASAGNKEKQWPPEKFAEVAKYLIKKHNAHIVVIGGKNDITEINKLILSIENKSSITDTNNFSIDELKAIISKLDIFIGVNTGPTYIAEAFDIPTVDLIGPVNAWDQPPQGQIHKMVFAPGKPEPLMSILKTRGHDPREAERIAQSTRVEDVVVAAEEALKEADKKRVKKV